MNKFREIQFFALFGSATSFAILTSFRSNFLIDFAVRKSISFIFHPKIDRKVKRNILITSSKINFVMLSKC